MKNSRRGWMIGAVLFGAVLSGLGCGNDGGDGTPDPTDNGNGTPDPTDNGNGTAEPTGPRFAVALRLQTGGETAQQIVVGFTDDLESGELDVSEVLEVGGIGNLWGVDGTGDFYVTRGETRDVEKYRFEGDELVEVETLRVAESISGFAGEVMLFDGPDRGFLFQTSTGEAVELNLDTMEIVDSFDVSAILDPEGLPTFIGLNELYRGDEFVGIAYGTNLIQGAISPVSQIFFFDPATLTFDVRTAPCGGLTWGMEASNGDFFFATDPFVAAVHALDENAPEPCLVRLPADSRDPEPNPLRLNEITSLPTAGLVPSGESSILVRVLDTATNPLTEDTNPLELLILAGWDTWEINLTQPETARRTDRDPVAGQIGFFVIDGVVYENVAADDQASTVLVRTTGPGAPAPGLSTPGVPVNIVRLR